MSPEARSWTPKDLLDWTEDYLQGKGVPTPRLDAELLLAHVLGCQRIELYLQFDRLLDACELARYRKLVRERGHRRPVAYLTGETGFWNLTLAVDEGILIPSPDTEALVEAIVEATCALRREAPDRPLKVLELGTGSAAIPLAVCSEANGLHWIAVERSSAAIALAARNRKRHAHLLAPRGNALWLVLGDRFQAIHPRWRPDVVAGNPPYIPSGTIDRLMPEVSRAEPRMALEGGPDGGDFQRYMLAYAAGALPRGGRVLLEMGAEQTGMLKRAVEQLPALQLTEVRNDLSGHPRVLQAEKTADGLP